MLRFNENNEVITEEPVSYTHLDVYKRQGRNRVVFPADFVMIGASNPCPCGYLGDSSRQCTCSPGQIARYRAKLSGAMADRIDICVEITRIGYGSLKDNGGLSSEQMKKTVTDVRYMQMEKRGMLNGQMKPADIEKYCIPVSYTHLDVYKRQLGVSEIAIEGYDVIGPERLRRITEEPKLQSAVWDDVYPTDDRQVFYIIFLSLIHI